MLHSASNDDFFSPYLSMIERIIPRKADAVVAVSAAVRENYIRRFGEGDRA